MSREDSWPLSRLCIHQVTLPERCDFRQAIECLSQNSVTMTAVWRPKLEEIGAPEAVRILRDNGVDAVSYCSGGLLTADDPGATQRVIDDNRRWLDEAAAIGAGTMVTITGGLPEHSRDIEAARERAKERLTRIIPHAAATGVRLALEPLHPMVCGYRSIMSTLREANDWLDELDAGDVLGIAFDTYAIWWEPYLEREIARAGKRIINFHCSDWLPDTRHVRLDRGMLGDGVIDNRRLLGLVDAVGFDGPIEVEIFSERDWWQRDADEVLRAMKDCHRRAC